MKQREELKKLQDIHREQNQKRLDDTAKREAAYRKDLEEREARHAAHLRDMAKTHESQLVKLNDKVVFRAPLPRPPRVFYWRVLHDLDLTLDLPYRARSGRMARRPPDLESTGPPSPRTVLAAKSP